MNNEKSFSILGVLIAVGLIGAGYEVSNTLYKARLASNIVTVKGFAERDVKANLALWTISFSIAGDKLPAAYDQSHADETLISDFLIKEGLKKDDIKVGDIQVTDLLTNQFRSKDAIAAGGRYTIQNTVSVRSENVDLIDKATHELGDLIKQGIVLTGNTTDYQFTKLNDIKTDMLREATQNARQAAEQFARDSGSKVGSIQSANQGFFSIVSRDNNNSEPQDGDNSPSSSSIYKKARVVTTVTYYLDK